MYIYVCVCVCVCVSLSLSLSLSVCVWVCVAAGEASMFGVTSLFIYISYIIKAKSCVCV